MTSKKYRPLVERAFEELREPGRQAYLEIKAKYKREGLSEAQAELMTELKTEWRRSAANYELPENDPSVESFEVIGHVVVKNPNSPVAIAFKKAFLDPRKPNDWLCLTEALAKILLTKAPKKKKRARAFLTQLKMDGLAIRAANPDMAKSDVILKLKLKNPKSYFMAESTLGRLLTTAGVTWFSRPGRKRKRRR